MGIRTLSQAAETTNEEALFMMGLVKICSRRSVVNGRMIIGTCSKLSYIISNLADAAGLDVIDRERLQVTGFVGKVARKCMNRLRVDWAVSTKMSLHCLLTCLKQT